MNKDYLIFGAPFIEPEEIEEVVRTLSSGWIGTGPRVQRFEDNFKLYKKASNAVAVSSCSAALHLSLLASELKPGDEVIVPAMTFCATVNAIIHSGVTPVMADVDPRTMNIDPKNIQDRITKKTKAILLVHFAGRPCKMDEITDIANQHNLLVIEDCAHAIESEYKGKHCGTFGDYGCFSFYVTKNITTGEGGMVVCKDEEQSSNIKTMALHGLSKDAWSRFSDIGYKHYSVKVAGFKYNMTDIQAAIARITTFPSDMERPVISQVVESDKVCRLGARNFQRIAIEYGRHAERARRLVMLHLPRGKQPLDIQLYDIATP